MNILIKQARVIDPSSPFHGKTTDIFIENGTISRISNNISGKADQVISSESLSVSPGWMDSFANFADPGYEFKETILTGSAAAAAGGFTDVMVIPNTKPVIDNKGQAEYTIQKSRSLPAKVHPIGAITRNIEGRELAEMYDMKSSGAKAFSDGLYCVQSAGLFLKALQYVKAFDGVLIQMPDDKSVNPHGLMNEGIMSTRLGLAGKPAMAEELIVARDIKLVQYTESRIHFTGLASRVSLEYVRNARKAGIEVTCSVTPYHLLYCDEDLANYDTYLKVNPPLRTNEDRAALRQAVNDGTIDCVASHHLPHETDSKIADFEQAKFGMSTLEVVYPMLRLAMPDVNDEKWVELLCTRPRKIFGLAASAVKENETANLTLFDHDATWSYAEKTVRSKSRNSPLLGKELKGKVVGIINRDKLFLNS